MKFISIVLSIIHAVYYILWDCVMLYLWSIVTDIASRTLINWLIIIFAFSSLELSELHLQVLVKKYLLKSILCYYQF